MALLRAVGASRRQVPARCSLEASSSASSARSSASCSASASASVLVGAVRPRRARPAPSGPVVAGHRRWRSAWSSLSCRAATCRRWRASRVPPVAAMRDVAVDTGGRSPAAARRRRWWSALGGGGARASPAPSAAAAAVVGLGVLAACSSAAAAQPRASPGRSAAPRRAARPAARHDRRAGPGERRPQPQAHRGHRLGADDRAWARRRSSWSSTRRSGVDRQGARRHVRRRLRDQRRLVRRVGLPHEVAERGGRAARGGRGGAGAIRPARVDGEDTVVTGTAAASPVRLDVVEGGDARRGRTWSSLDDTARTRPEVGDRSTPGSSTPGTATLTVAGIYEGHRDSFGDSVLGLDD